MSTPTPGPWIADGYDLRQKNGRMIAYFGPHHTPADEYPLSCRLQDEANCQWVANARNELAAARERVRVLETALVNLAAFVQKLPELGYIHRDSKEPICFSPDGPLAKGFNALAATKEEIK